MKYLQVVVLSSLFSLIAACSENAEPPLSQDQNQQIEQPTQPQPDPEPLAEPWLLTANTVSASSIRLNWRYLVAPTDLQFNVYRDGEWLTRVSETQFIDTELNASQKYIYQVTAVQGEQESTYSNSNDAKTLKDDNNSGLNNGAVISENNIRLLDYCHTGSIHAVSDSQLDNCLEKVLTEFNMYQSVADIRGFTARLQRQHNAEKVDLGMKLFFSKALSTNQDTACATCHHPKLSCGGDELSLPIGVAATVPELLGVGRDDGQQVPSVPRHSQSTCNSGLWKFALFWDNRVKLTDETDINSAIRTDEKRVSDQVNAYDNKSLLMAQAHFPVTAKEEMGESTGFFQPQDYRESLANNLSEQWKEEFIQAFSDDTINFNRISDAIAAYETSQLFINNPFFEYIEGNKDSLTNQQKRGALFFYTNSGCSNCHEGAFFTSEKTRPPAYPQIGPGSQEGGADRDTYRVPTLLNVELTAPYGHAGQFNDLSRVIGHYSNTPQSISNYFANNEVCQLPQFQHLGANCAELVAPKGLSLSEAVFERNIALSGNVPTPNFDDEQVAMLVAFLHSLTDNKARPDSADINALIPERNGGPDGLQLDAIDQQGNAL